MLDNDTLTLLMITFSLIEPTGFYPKETWTDSTPTLSSRVPLVHGGFTEEPPRARVDPAPVRVYPQSLWYGVHKPGQRGLFRPVGPQNGLDPLRHGRGTRPRPPRGLE